MVPENTEQRKVVILMSRRFLQKKYLVIIIPTILLLILLIAAAPGAVYREHRYRSATKALNSGNLETAEELLLEIPMYRDSDTLLNREIPYQRAGRLLEAADAGDESKLEECGYSSSDLQEDTTASILLYSAAQDRFLQLEDYRDSAYLAEMCRAGIDREKDRLRQEAEEALLRQNQGAYDSAVSLLDSGAYSEARALFETLGDFSDSSVMAEECRYRKAVSLFQFISRYDISRISAVISTDTDGTSIFSLPSEEALRLGTGCIEELRSSCGKDPTDVRLEDMPSGQMPPLKDALKEFFLSLGDYKDSASFPDQIDELTDYTRDFFMLCSTGDLPAAKAWLSSYAGEFPDRDEWADLLELYLPYCGNWKLYSGDAGLLPYTIGQNSTALSTSSRVILTRDGAVLRLSFGEDLAYNIDLPSELGKTQFINSDLGTGYYMGALNNRHLVYHRYDYNWKSLSSCDFIPA